MLLKIVSLLLVVVVVVVAMVSLIFYLQLPLRALFEQFYW
jgi:hypothetical protein